eukprot:TRINITY_DN6946_c0_g1_i1.p1 TRINITY_DN6946_c0_g1~~TRINITY_DN6946_c0_g1_i1.p1  ORF type:complete len:615 (+),score=92.86 TRINITY_DN6946_c0_g1_i1:35-1879(+)
MDVWRWCVAPPDLEQGWNGGKTKRTSLRADLKIIRNLSPYLWPKGDWYMRLRVVLSVICLVGSKIASVMIPITYKNSVNELSDGVFPTNWIIMYAVLKLASTAIVDLRDTIFVRVNQEARKNAGVDLFNHLHSLSLRFHVHRQTGAILRVFERGQTGITYLLRMLLFNIVPTFLEIGMVIVILLFEAQVFFSMIIFASVVGYVIYTFTITEWRTKFRRLMNEQDNDANNKATDSLINFETVKYFGNEEHEARRYEASLIQKMVAAIKSQWSLALLNVGQALIIGIAGLSVMLLAAKYVYHGDMTIGSFVLVNTYVLQMYRPLNFLGTSYRTIKQSLVDLENMFALLSEHQEITDADDAQKLEVRDGEIEFENVVFAYDESPSSRNILDGISFKIGAGNTVAIVGPTGAGKSTISRLLFRFYDTNFGSIKIDGLDIQDVTQKSLRRSIGVVPQDTVLFNDTIRYNILYGNVNSSESDMFRAAKMARIHEFIKTLPEGYETKVGERGLRLSGGEKQRVSIARAILKDPRIMIFDEATSSLDTKTEKEIQEALAVVSKGRTTLIIAHRLSTIVDSDLIMVLKDGNIAEQGTHEQLLEMRGEYFGMWQQQLQEEEKKP